MEHMGGHCITNPNNVYTIIGEIPQNYHEFVLFDPQKLVI